MEREKRLAELLDNILVFSLVSNRQHPHRTMPRVLITTTKNKATEIRKLAGVGTVKVYAQGAKKRYYYYAHSTDAVKVAEMVAPFVVRNKRQAELLMEYADNCMIQRTGKALTDEMIGDRLEYQILMQQINNEEAQAPRLVTQLRGKYKPVIAKPQAVATEEQRHMEFKEAITANLPYTPVEPSDEFKQRMAEARARASAGEDSATGGLDDQAGGKSE